MALISVDSLMAKSAGAAGRAGGRAENDAQSQMFRSLTEAEQQSRTAARLAAQEDSQDTTKLMQEWEQSNSAVEKANIELNSMLTGGMIGLDLTKQTRNRK